MWYFLIAILYIGVLIYLTNQAEFTPTLHRVIRWMMLSLAGFMFLLALNVLLTAQLIESMGTDSPELLDNLGASAVPIDTTVAMIFFLVTCGAVFLLVRFINSLSLRESFSQLIHRVSSTAAYKPESQVHTLAVALMFLAVTNTVSTFILLGGIEGVADSFADQSLDFMSFLFDATIYVTLSFLGVGLYIRRTLPQAMKRLGLAVPDNHQMAMGILSGIGLYILFIVMALIWGTVSSQDAIAGQTVAAEELFNQVSGSLLTGFALALFSAIGEEILFRGALQPIFGIWLTTVFFASIHIQYVLTPAVIIIFIIGYGLGLVRQRWGTVPAILAHFVYNFIPFILLVLLYASTG